MELDAKLNEKQKELVSQLSSEDIKTIDDALLLNSSTYWRKVSRVVGSTMTNMPNVIAGIPDVYYAQRVKHLVAEGKLNSQGSLDSMRYSEIRLPIEGKSKITT